ncbi:MAG TPA: flippase [Solirubrobacteraceae bacterium]|nr:flippase [Solirubrobacteraceae bacterium]
MAALDDPTQSRPRVAVATADPVISITELSEPEPVHAMRPSLRRMLVSAFTTALLQGGSSLMGFGTAVLLAHFLGPAGYGRYAFTLACASVLTIVATLGLNRFVVRGVAVYETQAKWELMKGLVLRASEVVLLASAVIAVIGCGVALIWLTPSLRWPFCVGMLLVPLTALTLLRQAVMQALGRVVAGQLPEYLLRPILILLGIGALRLAGGGALTSTTSLAINVAAVAVACVIGGVTLRRALPAVLTAVRPTYATREWVRAALPMMLISGVWLLNNNFTTVVVGSLGGAHAAGVYSVVEKAGELIVLVLVAANMPLAPVIARLHARRDREGLERSTVRVAQATLLTSVPIAAAFIVFPQVYLSIFGDGFQGGATALRIIAVGQLVNAAAGPAGNVLIMTGHERAAAVGMIVGLAANVVLGIALVPPFGVTGGAIAFAGSLVLWNGILVVLARRRVGINVTAFPWPIRERPGVKKL